MGDVQEDVSRSRSGDRRQARRRSGFDGRRCPARHRRRLQSVSGLVRQTCERTRRNSRALVRSGPRGNRSTRSADDRRARQTPDGSARRSRLRRLIHRLVCRRRKTRLRPHDPDHRSVPALRHDQAADRRLRRDHTMEFPDRHDHAQSCIRARGRMHDHRQAVGRNAALRTGRRQARARRGRSAGRA